MNPWTPDVEHQPTQGSWLRRVSIYGAGISGLTAAHELAIRGFKVRVYESEQANDQTGCRRMAIGGLARTQYEVVPKGQPGNFLATERPRPPEGQGKRYEHDISFPRGSESTRPLPNGELPEDVSRQLLDFMQTKLPDWPVGILHVCGLGDDAQLGTDAYCARLRAVRDFLRENLKSETFDPRHIVAPELDDEPSVTILEGRSLAEGIQRPRPSPRPGRQVSPEKKAVEPAPDAPGEGIKLKLVDILPGEHGFRFFPSFYRHLFSTMVEIPLIDRNGRLTGRRVFDNLVESNFQGIASFGRRIQFVRHAPVTSPFELLKELGNSTYSGYTPSDVIQLSLRLLRYMCTSTERRKAELEGISWWEYLEDYDPRTRKSRYRYSEKFRRDMEFSPRVLAAFDSSWGDSRTNGNMVLQLFRNFIQPLPKTDGTLNGPTSTAFLLPWRMYLEGYLGVEFRRGKLEQLTLDEKSRLKVEIQEESAQQASEEPTWDPDYHIVATDAASAEEVTKGLWSNPISDIGVPKALKGYVSRIPRNPRGAEPAKLREAPLYGEVPWDRFQTLTGIQFFFPSSVRLAEGYLLFIDAPWGLSAINSQQYWTIPPTLDRNGFGAILTVDIGNWYLPPGVKGPAPATSEKDDIALEVWEQLKASTELHSAAGSQFALPTPSWYHLDENIVFDESGRPCRNQSPYQIPVVGDWDNRPGPEPWDPLQPDPPKPVVSALPKGLWQADHGGYYVHWDKLVFAGTYLKTFTRLTSMEAANESARHAVNAIIDHYLANRPIGTDELQRRGMAAYGSQGTLTGWPQFRMTPVGEYCRIWDPEKNEFHELDSIKQLDARFLAAGLPHAWDVLQLEALARPVLQALGPTQDIQSRIMGILLRFRELLEKVVIPFGGGARR